MNEANVIDKKEDTSLKTNLQKFGRFLSGMVIPNLGAFIAFGLITALFIPTGWIPNESLNNLVGPLVNIVLPLLIGHTGGKLIHGQRGAVVGVLATTGIVVGSDIPMFLGAMVMGPLGGVIIKYFDKAIDGKVPSGFEMLVNNFSAGIIGAFLCATSYLFIGPIVLNVNNVIASAMQWFVDTNLLPLSALIIEPAKVLFLNNAVDHGILGPMGLQQAAETGKSVLFLLVTNPGPGLGILLAYLMFSKGRTKQSVPGAIIIHFLGGIHELYFPYVLMNPLTLIGVIAGGISGTLTFILTGVGTVATPSPGSIFAVLAMTPKGNFIGVSLGIIISTAVSFAICSIFVKKMHASDFEGLSFETEGVGVVAGKQNSSFNRTIEKIVVACDAGMGSSAMTASVLQNKLRKVGIDNIKVIHSAIQQVPSDTDLIITHEELAQSASNIMPAIEHISISDYMNPPEFDELVERLKNN